MATPRWQRLMKEYVEAIVIAFFLAMFIRTFFIQAFKIPSGSMLDTLLIGDHLLVSKIHYGVKIPFLNKWLLSFDEPKPGDIVVFEFPKDTSKDYIKRVIGGPGDTLEIRDKVVYRNGKKLDEPYVQHTDPKIMHTPRDNMPAITVPEGHYFCMGDNRDESFDSRFWGFVDKGKIVGQAFIIYWSWGGLSDLRLGRIGKLVE